MAQVPAWLNVVEKWLSIFAVFSVLYMVVVAVVLSWFFADKRPNGITPLDLWVVNTLLPARVLIPACGGEIELALSTSIWAAGLTVLFALLRPLSAR
jgi:hypothetical protein